MIGRARHTPKRSIDSLVEADERLVWVDRFNPVRPRTRAVARWPYIRQHAYGTLCLVIVAVCAVALAIDPTFFRHMIPQINHHQVIMTVIALIACPIAIYAVVQDWTMLHHGERMVFDFVLTDQRMIARDQGASAPEVIGLDRIIACRLHGADLILTLTAPDGTARLWDLADPAGALSAFERTLDRFRSGAD